MNSWRCQCIQANDGALLTYKETEKEVLKYWHEAFKNLTATEQFKLFIKGSTSIDPKQFRDACSGSWKSKDDTLLDLKPDIELAAPAVETKLPKISKAKLETIGKAVVAGCHEKNVIPSDKKTSS